MARLNFIFRLHQRSQKHYMFLFHLGSKLYFAAQRESSLSDKQPSLSSELISVLVNKYNIPKLSQLETISVGERIQNKGGRESALKINLYPTFPLTPREKLTWKF
jgi:hypothetical protein